MLSLAHFDWRREPRNPILPPVPGSSYDCARCMNPYVIRRDDAYWLYYGGGDAEGRHRICLATAPVAAPTEFTRQGVVLDVGAPGAFDAHWCVLPLVRRFGDRWHLYWTGHEEGWDKGLQGFPGIGLATSEDGIHFTRVTAEPIITGDQTAEFPYNRGIAGGGTILEELQPDGSLRYRLYYTLAVGTPNADVRIDQEKHCAVCFSTDGLHWTDHRVIMRPRRDVSFEDIAVAAPFVWREEARYRMLYSGIGTRWGYYTIAEAVSADGLTWERGEGDVNLSLAPQTEVPDSWEQQMVEYPAVIREDDHWRLFYCGNGYGASGIGTATASLREIPSSK
jgi:predicted GH43/DUF377 family glycosyl hydrolase